jgi:hypothetical protein
MSSKQDNIVFALGKRVDGLGSLFRYKLQLEGRQAATDRCTLLTINFLADNSNHPY